MGKSQKVMDDHKKPLRMLFMRDHATRGRKSLGKQQRRVWGGRLLRSCHHTLTAHAGCLHKDGRGRVRGAAPSHSNDRAGDRSGVVSRQEGR